MGLKIEVLAGLFSRRCAQINTRMFANPKWFCEHLRKHQRISARNNLWLHHFIQHPFFHSESGNHNLLNVCELYHHIHQN